MDVKLQSWTKTDTRNRKNTFILVTPAKLQCIYLTIILRNRAEYRLTLSRLFNTLMTKHNFLRLLEKRLEKLPYFSVTHKITYIAGYLLSTHNEY